MLSHCCGGIRTSLVREVVSPVMVRITDVGGSSVGTPFKTNVTRTKHVYNMTVSESKKEIPVQLGGRHE
jgi:hypothetical protein